MFYIVMNTAIIENSVIGKIYIAQCLLSTVLKRRKIKNKRPGLDPWSSG